MTEMDEIARLSESMSAAMKQRDESYRRVTELNAENKKLSDEVDLLSGRIKKGTAKVDSLEGEVKDLKAQLMTSAWQVKTLTEVVRQTANWVGLEPKTAEDKSDQTKVLGMVMAVLSGNVPMVPGEVPDERGNCSCSVSCGCHPYYQGVECPHCGGMCV